ncbi:DUF4112 domain-containing protein [Phenylobacterium sp.]|uniref:DUF4112 domain-containing protein n=1 Tax=Phenylobacterium sp. TaxID=1871053 RepID=UPI002B7ED30F|nr:DUF4112 domain-containing protein [Phenylobacterium sp.]HVI33912.1 DUF4112 domain-containing protein [Phenylobacterium sp.]
MDDPARDRAHRAWRSAERIRKLSDRVVGVGPFGVGLDGVLSWVPGAGTLYSVGAGGLLLYEAVQAGASKATIARMAAYLALDSASSGVWGIGSIIDTFFTGHAFAARLFERAADSRASVGKRFNLAAAYEATGRLPEAVTIYRTLVDDGQYVTMRSNRPMNNPDVPVRRYNIAEESARRLTRVMVENPLMFPQQSGGALAATGFATPVAATVGGTTTSGRISDAQAMQLDRLATGGE